MVWGGLGLLLPWSLTNSGLWPHTPNVYTNYVATKPSGTEKYPVALQWQSGKQLAKWLSIGKIDPNLVSVAVDWSQWHPSGAVALDWLPHDIGIALALYCHCIAFALSMHWHCIGSQDTWACDRSGMWQRRLCKRWACQWRPPVSWGEWRTRFE